MNIFVINSGSSSIKYQLIEMPSETVVCNGIVERIGKEDATVIHKICKEGNEVEKKLVMKIHDHERGVKRSGFSSY